MISNELLKKKILDEAIHGRLVENDSSLKPIDVPSIDNDIPFEIPNNWKWVKFSDVSEFNVGKTPPTKDLTYWGDEIDWVSISDMNHRKTIKSTNRKLNNKSLKNISNNRLVPPGTLLMSFKLTIGRLSITNKPCVHNEAIISIYPKQYLSRDYLMNALDSLDLEENVKSAIKGKTLNSKSLANILIPIPPLEEQEKIAKKIEELFELVDKKEKNDKEKEKLKTLLKEKILDRAIHGELVENDLSLPIVDVEEVKENVPFEIPNNCKWSKLGRISDYGKNKKVKGINISKDEWILELEDIEKNTGKILNKIYQADRNAISDKNIFFKGNLLYGKLRPYLNKCVIADEDGFCCTEIEPIILNSNIEAKYIQRVLMSKYFLNYVTSCSYGAKMPRLGTKDAKNAMIPIPPLEQQKKIVEKIEKCFELIEQL